jgi:hypothetical protein
MEVMTNWLRPFGDKVPSVKKTASLPAKPDFDRKLAAFKKAHGVREQCVVRFACSRHGRHFDVVYERAEAGERFKITEIRKLGEQNGSGASAGAVSAKRFAVGEFDLSSWKCVYCNANSTIHCHCGSITCDGQYLADGARLHRCAPGCGAVSPLGGRVTELAGSSGASRTKKPSGPALPSRSGPLLPHIRS